MIEFTNEPFELETRCGEKLRGTLWIPETEGKSPLAIICPGILESMRVYDMLANYLAQVEVCALTFDYSGGHYNGCVSDGNVLNMSVMTNLEDLRELLDYFEREDRFSSIHLIGFSQGGLVAALAAAENPERIGSLGLFSPAYVIPDHVRDRFPSVESIPDEVELFGQTLGGAYYRDLYDMDVWSKVAPFDKPTLIFCGSEDELVPNAYAFKASELYGDCELIRLDGAGHSFTFRESFPLWSKVARMIHNADSGLRESNQ